MIKLQMVCVCKSEGQAEAKALMEEVYRRLGEPSENFIGLETNDGNFLTNVCYSLNFDYDARITSIATDQWHGVAGKYHGDQENAFYVECDQVEHGIAAIWKAFADAGPREEANDEDTAGG